MNYAKLFTHFTDKSPKNKWLGVVRAENNYLYATDMDNRIITESEKEIINGVYADVDFRILSKFSKNDCPVFPEYTESDYIGTFTPATLSRVKDVLATLSKIVDAKTFVTVLQGFYFDSENNKIVGSDSLSIWSFDVNLPLTKSFIMHKSGMHCIAAHSGEVRVYKTDGHIFFVWESTTTITSYIIWNFPEYDNDRVFPTELNKLHAFKLWIPLELAKRFKTPLIHFKKWFQNLGDYVIETDQPDIALSVKNAKIVNGKEVAYDLKKWILVFSGDNFKIAIKLIDLDSKD